MSIKKNNSNKHNTSLNKSTNYLNTTYPFINSQKQTSSGMDFLKNLRDVNIENVTDEDYQLVTQIYNATITRQIQWLSQSFISMLTDLVFNKPIRRVYTACYKDLKIELVDNFNGNININVTKGVFKKKVLNTFIPFKPIFKHTPPKNLRSRLFYKLYSVVKYQVDPYLSSPV